MALNALGGFQFGNLGPRMGRFGARSRFGRGVRGRGFGDLIVAQQVQAPARRYVPVGPRFLGDLPSRGQLPRFTPPARFAGGRFGGPRRGLRMRGLGAHGDDPMPTPPKFDPRDFTDFEGGRPVKAAKGSKPKKKGPKPGRAVRCKMVCQKGGKKRKMCWDKNGRLTRVPKRKK